MLNSVVFNKVSEKTQAHYLCAGTLITSDQGQVGVENLAPGAKILSRDNGYITLRAMRQGRMSGTKVIHIPAGTFQENQPCDFSPTQRILFNIPQAEMQFGTAEILVSADHLTGHKGIKSKPTNQPINTVQLLFDHHEIIRVNDCWTESTFIPDDHKGAGWISADGDDLQNINHQSTARLILKDYEAKLFIQQLNIDETTYLPTAYFAPNSR